MNYTDTHIKTYNALADEYEERADSLMDITTKAMEYFTSHLKPGGKVLDVGCGVGIAMSILNKNGFQVSGVEVSPAMAKYAQKRNPGSEIIIGDFLKTRFNNKYDGILEFAFMQLFPKKEALKVIKKIKLILKPGGFALIGSTKSDESREGWEVKPGFSKKVKRFRKYWTEEELEESLVEVGFTKVAFNKYTDPYGKVWMDFIVKKPL